MRTARILLAVCALAAVSSCTPTPPAPEAPAPTTTPTTPAPAVNSAPVIAGVTATPSASTAPATLTLSAQASDADGDTLTYSWSITRGSAAATASGASTTASLLDPGTYRVELLVADGCAPGVGANDFSCRHQAYHSTTVTLTGWDPATIARREQAIAADLVARANLERTSRGLNPLTVDSSLTPAARTWAAQGANAMPTHDSVWLGSNTGRGENIHWRSDGSRDELIDTTAHDPGFGLGYASHWSWMHSPSHRATLLLPRMTATAVAVVCDQTTGSFTAVARFTGTPSVGADPATTTDVVYATPAALPGSGTTCTRG